MSQTKDGRIVIGGRIRIYKEDKADYLLAKTTSLYDGRTGRYQQKEVSARIEIETQKETPEVDATEPNADEMRE